MPFPLLLPRCTRLSTYVHPCSIKTHARINHLCPFIHFTVQLWNCLPVPLFPLSYDLQLFKEELTGHISHWICHTLSNTHVTFSRSSALWACSSVLPMRYVLFYYKKNKIRSRLCCPCVDCIAYLYLMSHADPVMPIDSDHICRLSPCRTTQFRGSVL